LNNFLDLDKIDPVKESAFITRKEVMAYLRISSATLQRLMKRHAFPYIKLEKKILFRKEDIDKYLEAHMVK